MGRSHPYPCYAPVFLTFDVGSTAALLRSVRITPSTKRLLIGILSGLAALLLVAFAVFQWKRQQLLAYALKEVKAKIERKYPIILTLGPARFAGFKTVEIQGMSLVPRAAPTDTLLTARRLQASLSVRSLFAGRPVFSDLQIITARLTARKTATSDNYGFLIKKQKASTVPARHHQGHQLRPAAEPGPGNGVRQRARRGQLQGFLRELPGPAPLRRCCACPS